MTAPTPLFILPQIRPGAGPQARGGSAPGRRGGLDAPQAATSFHEPAP